jgi:hypothetical protein
MPARRTTDNALGTVQTRSLGFSTRPARSVTLPLPPYDGTDPTGPVGSSEGRSNGSRPDAAATRSHDSAGPFG